MEYVDTDIESSTVKISDDNKPRSAVNTLILDYYKKFGKKRDLEQYFSLSTAQSDLRDPSSSFWRRMKAQSDSSDSGEKRSESSSEICRISIKCSHPETTSSQDENHNTNESESPPIVTEFEDQVEPHHSNEDSGNSEDDQSHKSFDVTLDTSVNKQLSPTSSVTSQRKLEWDSLADVGYGNESDKKTSASSLSTLERLALQQHYSNSDTKQESIIGTPAAHSTIQDSKDTKDKVQKGNTKKTSKIYNKNVDLVEFDLPYTSNESQAIHVNLTKHISFNVEKDELVKDFNTYVTSESTIQPKKVITANEKNTEEKKDKEIQTTLKRNIEQSSSFGTFKSTKCCTNKLPVLISLNTIKRRNRRNKVRAIRKKLKNKKDIRLRKDTAPLLDKNGDQLSEAESFEYLPGHMYNQNKLRDAESHQAASSAANKSSNESSGAFTTDSSKTSNYSFAKDLEKCINLLKTALQKRYKDSSHKKNLIKEVVHRLIESRYKDDESTTDFLSGLSFDSKKLGLGESNYTTTSTSDSANTYDNKKATRPKKSILRTEKNALSSVTQSAPNLPLVTEKSNTILEPNTGIKLYHSESDGSYKQRKSDKNITKTSSEEIYNKYIQALMIEESYRKYLNDDKENIRRHRLVNLETTLNEPEQVPIKTDSRLKDLLNDLVKSDYVDGSGDASKLKKGSSVDLDKYSSLLKQQNHSVFTLSSCSSDNQNKKGNLKKKFKKQGIETQKAESSKRDNHYCFCPYHSTTAKVGVTDSSVQVNLKYQCGEFPNEKDPKKQPHIHLPCAIENINRTDVNSVSDDVTQMRCLCLKKSVLNETEMQEKFFIYKCPCLSDKPTQKKSFKTLSTASIQCGKDIESHNSALNADKNHIDDVNKCGITKDNPCILESKKVAKSSQTDIHSKLLVLQQKISDRTMASWSSDDKKLRELSLKRGLSGSTVNLLNNFPSGNSNFILECTRCIQTEISINPKISDPSLTDINLINDAECVQLISEDIKKSKTCSSAGCSHFESKKVCGPESFAESNWSENISLSRKYSNTDLISKNTNFDICSSQFGGFNTVKLRNAPENFTIPIQGTNMTLMVSIGSNPSYPTDTKKELCNQGVGTDKYLLIDKGTCLTDECSKAVQSETTNMFPEISIRQPYLSSQCNVESVECVNEINTYDQNVDHVDTQNKSYHVSCLIDKPKFNTYPKMEPLNSQKQLPRLNTERGSVGCSQTVSDDGNNSFGKGCQQKINSLHQYKSSDVKSLRVCCKNYDSAKETAKINESSVNSEGCNENPVKISIDENKTAKLNLEVTNKCQSKDEVHIPIISSDNCCKNSGSTEVKLQKINRTALHNSKPEDTDHCQQDLETDLNKLKTCETVNYKKYEENSSCASKNVKANDCISNSATNMAMQEAVPKTFKEGDQKEPDECVNCTTKSTNTDKQVSPRLSNVKLCNTASNPDSQCNERVRISNIADKISDTAVMCATSAKKDIGTQKQTDKGHKLTKLSTTFVDKNLVEERNKNCNKNSNLNKATNTDDKSKKSLGSSKTHETQKSSCSSVTNTELKKPKCFSSSKSHEAKKDVLLKILETNNIDYKHCEAKDPILDLIQDITNRYNKKDIDKSKRKKCFKEIITVLGYLLDTEESTDNDRCKTSESSTIGHTNDESDTKKIKEKKCCSQEALQTKKMKGQGVCTETHNNESSDISISTEIPGTSSDSATCKVLNKIKKECEKYQQKRCKSCRSGTKKCEVSSSTSVNCDRCNRVHHCSCRGHRCKGHRGKLNVEKIKKKCVAYNLIIQTSDSMMNEETICGKNNRPLKNVIVKIPPKRKHIECLPFKEVSAKIEKRPIYSNDPCSSKSHQQRSLPNDSEISSIDECNRSTQVYSLREYLEKNRPDFIDQTSKRQDCLKMINESRNEDPSATSCLKMVVIHPTACMGCKPMENMCCGGLSMRCNPYMQPCMPTVQGEVTTIAEPKFISEREMKKHSERIYKSLPEVQRKKDELKKEKIKKANLLMAELFKRNLQKKTLRGSVNLSNYSTVVKI